MFDIFRSINGDEKYISSVNTKEEAVKIINFYNEMYEGTGIEYSYQKTR